MRKINVLIALMMTLTNTLSAQDGTFIRLIEQATKAPSGHNAQPWLFKIKSGGIEICADTTRRLPVVDPNDRELFVSLGCATENLCITATQEGYAPEVHIEANGKIFVSLEKGKEVQPDTLASQIDLRQTTKRKYDGKLIDKEKLRILNAVHCYPGVSVYFYERGSSTFDTLAQYIFRGNEVQMNNVPFINELKSWMRYNRKHQNEHLDGLSYATFGAPNLPKSIARSIISKSINARTQNKTDRMNIYSSSHLVLLTTQKNTVEEWINLGRTLERFLLTTTSLGIANAYLNQPNETPQLAQEMTQNLSLKGEYPTILLRIGYGKRRAYSKRRPVESVCVRE